MNVSILAVVTVGVVAFVVGTLYGFVLSSLCHAAKSGQEEGDSKKFDKLPSSTTKETELKTRETDR